MRTFTLRFSHSYVYNHFGYENYSYFSFANRHQFSHLIKSAFTNVYCWPPYSNLTRFYYSTTLGLQHA